MLPRSRGDRPVEAIKRIWTGVSPAWRMTDLAGFILNNHDIPSALANTHRSLPDGHILLEHINERIHRLQGFLAVGRRDPQPE